MNMRTFFVFTIFFISTVFAGQNDTSTNKTGYYCPNDCNNRAPSCDNEMFTTCWCLYGFSGDDCSKTVATDIPGAWYTERVFFVLSFLACMVVGSFAIVYGPHNIEREADSADNLTFFFNVRKGVLVTLVLLSFDSVLYYAIDPQGFEFILPFVVVQLLFGIVFVLLSILYTLVLFHWAEIYYTTIKVLKREEMLEKINSKYESNITLDTILGSIKFLNRLKIPFLILNILAFIIQEIRDLWFGITVNPLNPFTNYWTYGMLILYLIEAIGFIFYGTKLLSILPVQFKHKMRRVTILIVTITILFLASYIYSALAFTFLVHDSWTFIAADFFWRLVLLIIVIIVLSLFVKTTRRFPFISFGHSNSKPGSSGDAFSGEFNAVKVEAELEEVKKKESPSESSSSSSSEGEEEN